MKLTKAEFDKWSKWADEITADLTTIVNNQQIYKQFEEVANANWDHIVTYKGDLFCDFVRHCYGVQAALGIRRHIKIDKDSISLMKLADQMRNCAKQFTYEFYLDRYPFKADKFEWQKSTFMIFSENGDFLSEDLISTDMADLENIGGKVSDFVDRTMAHLDQKGPNGKITYDDLMKSIDLFNKVACKYITFITSDGCTTLKPTIQRDWKKIFSVPFDMRK
ncbi:MAG: hypothetical protein GQ522_01020 [Deltaproteobacteria bacterium]|nr:hypothetical protein [Deltaproteobacteria bacterium]